MYISGILSNSRIGLQVSRATVSDNAWNPSSRMFLWLCYQRPTLPPKAPNWKIGEIFKALVYQKTKRLFSTPFVNRYNHCEFYLILGSGCKSVARQFLTTLGIQQQKVFMTLLSTPFASPPKAPRSSFKSFEAITDPLCMIPFFKQWLSVSTLCFWNPNWSHKHNRLARSLWILLVIFWPKEYSWEHITLLLFSLF